MKSRAYQLFDEHARPLHGKHGVKDEVLRNGLLHGASHVWIWRHHQGHLEVLLQRRAAVMLTFPGLLDVSAAGHIDGGEEPLTAAIRETKEELGLTLTAQELPLIAVVRCVLPAGEGLVENEFQWLYLAQLPAHRGFVLEEDEVDGLVWKTLAELKAEVAQPTAYQEYVPHGPAYFATLSEAIERLARA